MYDDIAACLAAGGRGLGEAAMCPTGPTHAPPPPPPPLPSPRRSSSRRSAESRANASGSGVSLASLSSSSLSGGSSRFIAQRESSSKVTAPSVARTPALIASISSKAASRAGSGAAPAACMSRPSRSQNWTPLPPKNSSRVTSRSPLSRSLNIESSRMNQSMQSSTRANSTPPSTVPGPSRPIPISSAPCCSSAGCPSRQSAMAALPPVMARPSSICARYASGVLPASDWTPLLMSTCTSRSDSKRAGR
mmetsp:Transcript_15262/g.45428  ORF Transcript_15262/g.45428 Transcript_15262/m.45428 type:complete len:249 (+) Transcript_15262:439-1185(+)